MIKFKLSVWEGSFLICGLRGLFEAPAALPNFPLWAETVATEFVEPEWCLNAAPLVEVDCEVGLEWTKVHLCP